MPAELFRGWRSTGRLWDPGWQYHLVFCNALDNSAVVSSPQHPFDKICCVGLQSNIPLWTWRIEKIKYRYEFDMSKYNLKLLYVLRPTFFINCSYMNSCGCKVFAARRIPGNPNRETIHDKEHFYWMKDSMSSNSEHKRWGDWLTEAHKVRSLF